LQLQHRLGFLGSTTPREWTFPYCCHAETCGASRHAAAAAAASDVDGFSRTFGPTGVLNLEGTEGNDCYPP